MKNVVKTKKKTPKMLKVGKSCVIILLKENTEKLQKISQILIEESDSGKKGVDKPTRAEKEEKMVETTENEVIEAVPEENVGATDEVPSEASKYEDTSDVPDNADVSATEKTVKNEETDVCEGTEETNATTEIFPADHPLSRLVGQNAEYFVTYFSLDATVPVDLSEMLKEYNIALRVTDFKSFEEFPEIAENIPQKGKVLGAVKTINDRVNIFYRKGDTPHRQRFTIAHEFAHCCLNAEEIAVNGHVDFRLDIEEATEDEYKANVFAGELLIPRNVLDSIYSKVSEPNINTLAYVFDVSVNVMEERLKYLGYKYKKSILSSFQNQIEKFKYGLVEY